MLLAGEAARGNMTTNDIINLLKVQYRHPEWEHIIELRCGTSFGASNEKRIDFWVINCYESKGRTKLAYEIKVSRGDFLQELKDRYKRRRAFLFSNYFYFIMPEDIYKDDDIPFDCGLKLVKPNGRIITKIGAPYHETCFPTWSFVASIMRTLRGGAFRQGK
jgi:hypothetical protein